MAKKNLAALLGMAAAIGADYGPQANNDSPRPDPKKNEFQLFHDAFRRQRRMKRWIGSAHYHGNNRPHIGKSETRRRKREKVRAMKAAGHLRGDNRPFNQNDITFAH